MDVLVELYYYCKHIPALGLRTSVCQSAFVAELDEYGSGVLGGALLHGEDGAWLAE